MKRLDEFGGLEYLTAEYRTQDFPRHVHKQFLIGFIESGVHDVWCRGAWWHATSGTVATFAPDEPHFGGAGVENGWRQTMFYVPADLVCEVLQDESDRWRFGWDFRAPFHHNPKTAAQLKHLWRLLELEASTFEVEEALHEVLGHIFSTHSRFRSRPVAAAPRALERVREYIHTRADTSIQLNVLADIAGQSKRQLIAGFRRHYGMSPSRYCTQIRVERAQSLLNAGASIADVAVAAGFADQSHLTRHFRAVLGVTPARYVRVRA